MEWKDRLEFVLAATGTGLWTFESRTGRFEGDAGLRRLWGVADAGELTLDEFLGGMDGEDARRVRAYLAGEEPWPPNDIHLRVRIGGNDAERWIALRGRRSGEGAAAEVIGTARDITDDKRYTAQVHLLMREVTHRSKNLLAIIQAMARRTVKNSRTAADFEERFSARLRGLAFSHEILASQDWRGASLQDLVHGQLEPLMQQHGPRISIKGPVVFIRPEAAQNLGLALHELGTNAAQFGALAAEGGRVFLEWQIDADAAGPQWLCFTWREQAGRQVTPPTRRGFGHEVMERVVAQALDGKVQTRYPATGFEWSLRIPLSHISTEDLHSA